MKHGGCNDGEVAMLVAHWLLKHAAPTELQCYAVAAWSCRLLALSTRQSFVLTCVRVG